MTTIEKLVVPISELFQKRWLIGLASALIVLIVLPFLFDLGSLFLISRIMALSIAAMGFNLLWGYTGIISFGHSAFYGIGAYGFALLTLNFEVPTLISIGIASIIGGLAGLMIGALVLRLKGLFLAISAMAFGQLIWALNLRLGFTGGTDGLGIPLSPIFLSQVNSYYLILGIFLPSLLILRIITNSPFGLTIKSIRDQPLRVEFQGVNVFNYQLGAFAVSAFFTALGGALIALLIRGAYPDMLYWTVGGDIMLICLIGGIKVFLGPVVGAVVFEILDGIINRFTVYWPLVLGIILILVLIFFREGITGLTYRPYRKTVTGLNDDNA